VEQYNVLDEERGRANRASGTERRIEVMTLTSYNNTGGK